LTALATSCSNTTPAGFWTNFHKDLITSKISDQGPWGGHREIHWESNNVNTFSPNEILDFANKNGWVLADSISFTADSLTRQTNSENENNDYTINILIREVLPKWKGSDIKVFIFKTGWIAVEPGNTGETDKNGFVTLNSNGTELIVYHLWGE
jgi:hypothetical protein